MKIKVPSEEDIQKKKRLDRLNFIGGIIVGIIFFGIIGSKVFLYGFENVATYTWVALSIGVLSFGFLAKWFGSEFWQRLFGNN